MNATARSSFSGDIGEDRDFPEQTAPRTPIHAAPTLASEGSESSAMEPATATSIPHFEAPAIMSLSVSSG